MWERDKDDIRHQIDITLRAYIDQDWGTFQQTHTSDWCGFAYQSPAIIKGREALLAAANDISQKFRLHDYEMIEIEYRFWGDVCVTPYVARIKGMIGDDEPFEARLQSIAVYRKGAADWYLAASDFHVVPLESSGDF
ncbi:MAG: nuclear transport factor 2 family protein [Ardenticatenaceae bacterium]|nr:nuclear transport factor 2 family protein [Ardenticatenaceae bacterium]